MSPLILIAVVLGIIHAAPQPPQFFEPDEYSACCLFCGDPTGITFDKVYKTIDVNPGKMLFASYKAESDDPCKFNVQCAMFEREDGALAIDYCGVSLHAQKRDDKFYRNYVFGQCKDHIGQRGVKIDSSDGQIDLVGPDGNGYVNFPGVSCSEFLDPSSVNYGGRNQPPPKGCTQNPPDDVTYQIKFNSNPTDYEGDFSLRTKYCGWSFDFWPSMDDSSSCFQVCVEGGEKNGTLKGLCGDWNGNDEDDWTDCRGRNYTSYLETSMTQLAIGCSDGLTNGIVPESFIRTNCPG